MRKAFEVPARALRPSKRGVKAEQVDYKASSTQQLDPPTQAASSKAIETDNISDDDDDDDDDRPLAAALQASGRLSNLSSKPRQPETCVDSDPDEDVPLQDLLQRRSAEPATASTDTRPKWPSTPFEPKLKKAFAGAHGLSIKYFVPLASAALAGRDAAPTRSRAAMFDSALAVSEHGRIVTYAEECDRDVKPDDLPSRFLHLAERPVDKKSVKGSSPIDRVEDVVRLTSKVCAIASSTDQPLGLGNHSDYPVQVSLVTLDASRSARTHHLDERPHAWGASSITSFPRTDPFNSGSVDFATGGIDGVVHHWNWSRPTTTTSRLHTLHGSKPVVALEHLPSRTTLASASLGSVIGFDLSALTLGFSWNTSDHIVHLERTPDPKLMLGVLARRDYDQFRLFDVTGGNGPVSRPVLRFGWLNEAQGSLPLGRGAWHPHRRAMFAHAAEDGHVRVWDMRNARDALVDVDLEEEALVDVVWAAEGEEDVMYVAGTRGVRCVALVPP
uniref:WD40 repeat-like protein n=2 Tax=Kalmanozyma brasiliensis (strain GHG001) TaxID=1365824 RepID=V5GQL9_KALBG